MTVLVVNRKKKAQTVTCRCHIGRGHKGLIRTALEKKTKHVRGPRAGLKNKGALRPRGCWGRYKMIDVILRGSKCRGGGCTYVSTVRGKNSNL